MVNPWTLRFGVIIVFLIGAIVGFYLAIYTVMNAVEVVGEAFTVENVNMTIQLNQSMIMEELEHINRTRVMPCAEGMVC